MKLINIVNGPEGASAIVLGCMRMPALTAQAAAEMLTTAVSCGVNFFDHATCYGNGEAEKRFGDAFRLAGLRREDVYIQSKCGLHFDRQEFDWSRDDIIASAEESLSRLGTDYLDVLLLHRPDLLYEPEQVAEAFDVLHSQGKVRYFGVSNVSPGQLELLCKYVKQPLVINQLQFSLDQAQLIDTGLYVNNLTIERSVDRDNGLIDYCRLKDITIQAWSPLQAGMFQGCFVDDPKYPELNQALAEVAEKYSVSKTAVAIAWILRHPARMQAIAGTMNPGHLKDICAGADIALTHQEWYKLYLASGRKLP